MTKKPGVRANIIDYLVMIIFAVLMVFVILLVMSTNQPKQLKREVAEGELYGFTDSREYWCKLNDICIKDGYLYVLFGDQGVLKIYDSDGTYLKSFAFYNTKGGTSLHTDGQYVYLEDHLLNFYVFSSGEWINTIKYSNYGAYLEMGDTFNSAEDQRRENDNQYYVRYASIYRKREGTTPVQIIKRPLFFAYFQNTTPFLVIGYGMCLLLVLKRVSDIKKRRT